MNKQEEILSELKNFTGTEGYHKLSIMYSLKATDGVKSLFELCSSYWLGDVIGSVQRLAGIKENKSFIIWRIKKIESEEKTDLEALKSSFEVCAFWDYDKDLSESKNREKYLLYKQIIPYSDFPLDEYSFYQIEDVLLLRGEY